MSLALGYKSNFDPDSYIKFTKMMAKLPNFKSVAQKFKLFRINTNEVSFNSHESNLGKFITHLLTKTA